MKKTNGNAPHIELKLLDLLEQKKMTVTELSDKSGVTRQNIYLLLRDPRGMQFHTLARLCKALGVDPSTLLELQEN